MNELDKKIRELGPWFHNLHLPDGTQTAPNHFLGDFPNFKWKEFAADIPEDLSGWKVLDIGCNAGFYSVQLALRGAEVLAIDLDPHYLKQAKFVMEQFGLEKKVRLENRQVYDLVKEDQQFDLIIFMGVLYHLRYPMLALDIVTEKARNLMVFQTLSLPDKEQMEIAEDYNLNDRADMLKAGWPKMAFIEKRLNNDPTNWWAPTEACIEAMLRTCGMNVIKKPADEIYLCKKDPELTAVAQGWNRSEFLSAIGADWKKFAAEKVGTAV